MRLALDNHYPTLIAEQLRDLGYDAIAVIEIGWAAEDDEPLLTACALQHRALLTNNVADFAVIARRWQLDDRHHAGLIYTSDASLPRTRHNTGTFVAALAALMADHPADDALVDRTHWLEPTSPGDPVA